LPNITGSVPIRETTLEVRYLERAMNSRAVGCLPDYMSMNHLEVARGRFLSDEDDVQLRNVAVIAADVARTLFPVADPLGKPIQISGRAYEIVGVMKERGEAAAIGGSLQAQEYNRDVYIPLSTFQSRINSGDVIVRRTSGSFSAESVIYNQITFKVSKPENVIPTAEVVRETLQRTHGSKQDWAVVVPLELLKQADQLRNIFNVVLGSIAGISLLVGGIGIMNIMLATVTERTREIGIRRALGARRADIIQQFLTETIALSGTGGLIGVLLGLSTPFVFQGIQWFVTNHVLDPKASMSDVGRMFLDMTPKIAVWSLPVAFGFSVMTGLVFGVYPAQAAAKLDPIGALRHT
jgi:putative ABC transport system permease protein